MSRLPNTQPSLNDEHCIEQATYLNRGLPVLQRTLICSCGFAADGDDWEEAGMNYDNHLEGR